MKFDKVFVLLLYLAMVACLSVGFFLAINSVDYYQANDPIVLEEKVEAGKLNLKIETTIPGMFLVALGGFGLIVMIIKTPVRQILGYHSVASGGSTPHGRVIRPATT